MKKLNLFVSFALLINLINFDSRADDSVNNVESQIQEIVIVVNSSGSASNKTAKIEAIVKNLMDYDKFFGIVLPKGQWSKLKNKNLQNQIIEKYNKKYVNDYFNQITDCSPLKITFSDIVEMKSNTSVLSGSYICSNNDNKSINLSISKSSGKVLNIFINNISFINNQKSEFNSTIGEKSDSEIESFLLKK